MGGQFSSFFQDTFPDLSIESGGGVSASLVTLSNGAALLMRGGTLNASVVELLGDFEQDIVGGCPSCIPTLGGYGIVNSRFHLPQGREIIADGGVLALGDGTRFDGFSVDGKLTVNNNATMVLQSFVNFARLGYLTELKGGTLSATAGVALDSSRTLTGTGTVNARVAASLGSTIYATGNLALGDAMAPDGFHTDGILHTNNNVVTLNAANAAVLGSLTQLGNANGPGTLMSQNGLLVDFGRNLIGYGVIVGPVLNNGTVNGSGPSVSDLINFQGPVKGDGQYKGTVSFSGGFSPGLSPTLSQVENVVFASSNTLTMEIGGLSPGSQYDRIVASGNAKLGGTLEITLINGFAPNAGETFDLILAHSFFGQFGQTLFPNIRPGLGWTLSYLKNVNGLDLARLEVAAVPVPAGVWLLGSALSSFGLTLRKRAATR